MKKYKCEIPDCNREVVIRSKIKNRDSEYFGKMACPICAEKHNVQKEKKAYSIPHSLDAHLVSERPQSKKPLPTNKPKSYKIPTRYASSKVKTFSQQTAKNKSKRKEERADYPEFFKKHIECIKENNIRCQECDSRLRGDVSEVAHVLKKSNNPEVATHPENFVYLCGLYSTNNCHASFDSNLLNREKMKVFPLAVEKFKLFKEEVINITKEYLHYEQFC